MEIVGIIVAQIILSSMLVLIIFGIPLIIGLLFLKNTEREELKELISQTE